MAMKTHQLQLGVDVAKNWLDISDGTQVTRIDNHRRAIRAFMKQLSTTTCIAIESTSTYHELFIELAMADEHTIYLVDAYRLSRYRDAHLLHRYMYAEKHQLTPFKPIPTAVKRLNSLLKARAKLAKERASIGLALKEIAELTQTRLAIMNRIKQAMMLIDKRVKECIKLAGYTDDYQRCLAIPGVGPQNAAALVATYHRGTFRKADSFIAFIGLDVRVCESGYFKGRRKLTKKGNPEIRRLLFNAAKSGSKTSKWDAYYLSMKARGHSTTASAVALSRKIARLAFALLRDQSNYHAI